MQPKMTRCARACVLIGIMLLLQAVGAAEKDITGLQQVLNMLSKQLDSAHTEQTTNKSSFENHTSNSLEGNVQPNIDSYILRAISTFLRYFEDDRRFHRNNYHKLESAISRLGADVDALTAARPQEMTERQNFEQRLNDAKKEQEETKVQIAALDQKINDDVQENKRYLNSQNQSTVANSQRTERLVQRVEELKQEILARLMM